MGAFFSLLLAVDTWKYKLLQNVVHQVTGIERTGPSESEPDSSEVFCFLMVKLEYSKLNWRSIPRSISDILAKQAYYCIERFLW